MLIQSTMLSKSFKYNFGILINTGSFLILVLEIEALGIIILSCILLNIDFSAKANVYLKAIRRWS